MQSKNEERNNSLFVYYCYWKHCPIVMEIIVYFSWGSSNGGWRHNLVTMAHSLARVISCNYLLNDTTVRQMYLKWNISFDFPLYFFWHKSQHRNNWEDTVINIHATYLLVASDFCKKKKFRIWRFRNFRTQ